MGRKRHTAGADHHCTAGGRGGSGPRQIREADQPGARHHRADVLAVEAGVRRDEGEPGARRLQELERENGRLKREVLADLFVRHGPPEYLRSDNGPEFSAKLVRR